MCVCVGAGVGAVAFACVCACACVYVCVCLCSSVPTVRKLKVSNLSKVWHMTPIGQCFHGFVFFPTLDLSRSVVHS